MLGIALSAGASDFTGLRVNVVFAVPAIMIVCGRLTLGSDGSIEAVIVRGPASTGVKKTELIPLSSVFFV